MMNLQQEWMSRCVMITLNTFLVFCLLGGNEMKFLCIFFLSFLIEHLVNWFGKRFHFGIKMKFWVLCRIKGIFFRSRCTAVERKVAAKTKLQFWTVCANVNTQDAKKSGKLLSRKKTEGKFLNFSSYAKCRHCSSSKGQAGVWKMQKFIFVWKEISISFLPFNTQDTFNFLENEINFKLAQTFGLNSKFLFWSWLDQDKIWFFVNKSTEITWFLTVDACLKLKLARNTHTHTHTFKKKWLTN